MIRIWAGNKRRRQGRDAVRGRRHRPSVMVLEGRELLSTLTVSNTNDSGAGSLRAAVAQADADGGGDTIVFSSLFDTPQTITLTGGQLELSGTTARTTIAGPGANLLSVSGDMASRVLQIDGAVTASISGLTITGGSASNSVGNDNGGGVQVMEDGSLTMTDCTVSGNAASGGGGLGRLVCLGGGSLTMTDCTVSSNNAAGGGGLYNDGATLTMTNCTVSGNSTTISGGGVGSYGTTAATTLTSCTVSANSTGTSGGGGLHNHGGSVTLTDTIVAGNYAGGDISGNYTDGGHNLIGGNPLLAALGDYGGPTFTMAPLPGSPAIGGGASTGTPDFDQRGFPRGGSVDIGAFQTQPGISVNTTADGVGSGPGELNLRQAVNLANALSTADSITFSNLFNTPQVITLTAGELMLTDQAMTTITGPGADLLTISGNKASRVFEIRFGSAELSGLTITGGSGGSAASGGGLYNNDGTLALSNCTVSGNSANGGGGLFNQGGTSTLTDCTINGNTSYAQGGGLLQGQGSLILLGCTLSGNRASDDGGGLAVSNTGGSMSLSNCTVTGNTAATDGGGLESSYSPLIVGNCTISGNQCGKSGGGIYSVGPQRLTSLTNTIVAGNSGGDISGSYFGSNNLILSDPLLAPLGNYGGPTPTMALLPGSPAIGGGTTTGAPATDQRGSRGPGTSTSAPSRARASPSPPSPAARRSRPCSARRSPNRWRSR